MLHPPGSRRERILAYGTAGAGKSNVWLAIAEWLHKTKAPGHVWVIDTDCAWDAYRPLDGHLDDIVTAFPIHQWDDYKVAVAEIRVKGKAEDWFSIDLVDVVWDAAQEGWSEKAEGKDIDEFFLMHKVQGTNPGGEYGTNWVQIKRMYRSVVNLIVRFPGHVVCCASASEVKEKKGQFGDDATVVAKYGRVGYKPNGEGKLAHLFHTEIYFVDSPSGYRMTSVKDRQRERFAGEMVSPDFVLAYLIRRAGWKP